MGMIFLQTLTHDSGTFTVALVVLEALCVHRVENAAVHRFQPVTDIRQGAANDHRHGIIEIRPPHLFFNVDGLEVRGSGRSRRKTSVATPRRS
jgi:hypothetical protein